MRQAMWCRLWAISKKEFRQIRRDRRTLALLLFFPSFMLVLFGYALNFDFKHQALALYDESQTAESRAFARAFTHSEYFDLTQTLTNKQQVDRLMGRDLIRAALIIPRGFSDDLAAGRTASVQILLDGANASAAGTALGYIQAIVQDYSARIQIEALERRGGQAPALPLDVRPRVWYNPELKSAKFLLPGLIGFILSITAVVSIALSIVRERERGTMEQLVISPVSPFELIIGKILPYIFISLSATAAILLAGALLFGISVKGSFVCLFCITLAFVTACLGMGMLISTLADTQQVAFQISILSTMLPTFLLSGIIFPIRNMPDIIQMITYAVPARYFLVALRGVILKGTGMSAYGGQVLALLAFASITVGVSMLRMRRKQI
jgi:ABC-2 type transport system permease protein